MSGGTKNQVMALNNMDSHQRQLWETQRSQLVNFFFLNLLMWCLRKDVLKIKYLKCYEMKNKQTNEALAFKEHYFKSKRKMLALGS